MDGHGRTEQDSSEVTETDMTLLYMVHDLGDPAVERRLHLLGLGGVRTDLFGFRRGDAPVTCVRGITATDLGRTTDGKLVRRIFSLAAAAARLNRWRDRFAGASVIVARNLEMLLLASLVRRRFAPRAALVYECLDVHSVLVSPGAKGRLFRMIEQRLLGTCQLLIVSSPAFVDQHFRTHYDTLPPVMLLENKVLQAEFSGAPRPEARAEPPWRIGWFGVIRCRRSLLLLAELLRARPGLVEVVIRGRPARTVLPDFDAIVAATPGMAYLGPYDRSRDLAALYGSVDFTWAMDFYEAGANSAWLLPNRLYEGGAHGAVQIALAGVATGAWLSARCAGAVLAEPLPASLTTFFDGMNPARYAAARAALAAVPTGDFVADAGEATRVATALAAVASRTKSNSAP